MLIPARGLSALDLAAIADLQARSVAADGGRLKLEWGVLATRAGDRVEDLLWRDGDRLLGFLGMYAFGPATVELAGMVDPVVRRRGIGTALLATALPLAGARGFDRALLVTPRESVGGQAFARSRRARLDHSEHALVLTGPPSDTSTEASVRLRTATPADAEAVSGVLSRAFGHPLSSPTGRLHTDPVRTVVIETGDVTVGTMRLTFDPQATADADLGAVHGFAVEPSYQGRGIGGAALRQACRQLREQGARRIGLEVAVDNERALGLYTAVGFQRVTTEDYYALEL